MLYWVLFLPGIAPYGEIADYVDFDALSELSRILLYDLPALLLILYLFLRGRPSAARPFAAPPFAAPSKDDLLWAGLSLAALLGIAGGLSLLSAVLSDTEALPAVSAPRGLASWLLMPLASLSTGYLEETYFRAYLLTRFEEAGLGRLRSIAVSSLLFALCHLYEGPWGVVNAAAAGLVLSHIFYKRRSVHGIAWAHGLYNALVYATGV